MTKYQKEQKERRDARKSEKRMERHKINSELKKVIDTKMNTEDVEEDLSTLTVYQNKNGEGWVKVEIPCECSPRLKPSGFSAPNKDKA